MNSILTPLTQKWVFSQVSPHLSPAPWAVLPLPPFSSPFLPVSHLDQNTHEKSNTLVRIQFNDPYCTNTVIIDSGNKEINRAQSQSSRVTQCVKCFNKPAEKHRWGPFAPQMSGGASDRCQQVDLASMVLFWWAAQGRHGPRGNRWGQSAGLRWPGAHRTACGKYPHTTNLQLPLRGALGDLASG